MQVEQTEQLEIEDRWLVCDMGAKITRRADDFMLISQSYHIDAAGDTIRVRQQIGTVDRTIEVTRKEPYGSAVKERTSSWRNPSVEQHQTLVGEVSLAIGSAIDKTRLIYNMPYGKMEVDMFHLAPGCCVIEFEHNDLSRHGMRAEPAEFIREVFGEGTFAVNITGLRRLSNQSLSCLLHAGRSMNSIFANAMSIKQIAADLDENRPPALSPELHPVCDIMERMLIGDAPTVEHLIDAVIMHRLENYTTE